MALNQYNVTEYMFICDMVLQFTGTLNPGMSLDSTADLETTVNCKLLRNDVKHVQRKF